MKYGVLVCPTCKKAKGVDIAKKTTKCHRCGKVLQLQKLKIYYKSSSLEQIQRVIGLLNAELDGSDDDFKKFLEKEML
jgi:transposase-like protein